MHGNSHLCHRGKSESFQISGVFEIKNFHQLLLLLLLREKILLNIIVFQFLL